MDYKIQLQVYEGPLDLLYDLIAKNKIDISDISIVEITNQYIEYLSAMEQMDLEITSEFIAMASKLLEIKSKYLLYKKKDDEEDPRIDLVVQLEEYKKYKDASIELNKNISYISDRFYRNKQEIVEDTEVSLDEITLESMIKVISSMLSSNKQKEEDKKPDEKLNRLINHRVVPIEDRTRYIRSELKNKSRINFSELVEKSENDEIIATFLSLLELIKMREVRVEQEFILNDITIIKLEDCNNRDMECLDEKRRN
ncbi:MAG: segregation/condensation protein A [Clostridioides sp.]|jgi:segregation and condensation protein A|nr:segregation/condensation protein A [Clostridioides sp.]